MSVAGDGHHAGRLKDGSKWQRFDAPSSLVWKYNKDWIVGRTRLDWNQVPANIQTKPWLQSHPHIRTNVHTRINRNVLLSIHPFPMVILTTTTTITATLWHAHHGNYPYLPSRRKQKHMLSHACSLSASPPRQLFFISCLRPYINCRSNSIHMLNNNETAQRNESSTLTQSHEKISSAHGRT